LASGADHATLKERRDRAMDVQLCEDLERLVQAQLQSGRYTREEDVIQDVWAWLRDHQTGEASEQPSRPRPMTDAEFRGHLLRTARISELPVADGKGWTQGHWKPIPIEGEPLSQTILRERR